MMDLGMTAGLTQENMKMQPMKFVGKLTDGMLGIGLLIVMRAGLITPPHLSTRLILKMIQTMNLDQ